MEKLKTIRVAAIGTHGSGKSTFLSALARVLKGAGYVVGTVDELATVSRVYGLPINQDTTMVAQWWILAAQTVREIELANSGAFHVILSDRSAIDNPGYAYLRFGEEAQGHVDAGVHYCKNVFPYNKLFLLKGRNDCLAENGTRAADPEKMEESRKFQEGAESTIMSILDNNKIPYVSLPEHESLAVREKLQLWVAMRELIPLLKERFPNIRPPLIDM